MAVAAAAVLAAAVTGCSDDKKGAGPQVQGSQFNAAAADTKGGVKAAGVAPKND